MSDAGVYGQVCVNKKDAQILHNIVCCVLDGVAASTPKSLSDPDNYHATILYSRIGNVDDIQARNSQYIATIKNVEVWTEHEVAMVCTLSCPSLEKRHKQLMEKHDLQWDYPDYKPHITIAYDVNPEPQLLKRLKHKILGMQLLLGNESFEALDTEAK